MHKVWAHIRYGIVLFLAMAAIPSSPLAAAEDPEEGVREQTASSTPRRVEFLVWMIDIDSIDSQNQTFTVNMGLRLSWKDETLAHDGLESIRVSLDEIWHPRISLGGIQSKTKMDLDEEAEVTPDGTIIYRQRYIGPLSQPLNLSEFPLDTQTFTAHFWATGFGTDDVLFEPEQMRIGDNSVPGGAMSSELSMTDWRIDSFRAQSRPLVATNELQFAGFAFDVVATRHFSYYLWQVIAPLTLIVIMSWVPFWVNPANAATQFSIASSTVLTLIAYRFVAAGFVPRLSYMTRLDEFVFACTALVFLVFLQVLVTSRLAEVGHPKIAIGIDKYCRFLFPLAFVLVIARFWLF